MKVAGQGALPASTVWDELIKIDDRKNWTLSSDGSFKIETPKTETYTLSMYLKHDGAPPVKWDTFVAEIRNGWWHVQRQITKLEWALIKPLPPERMARALMRRVHDAEEGIVSGLQVSPNWPQLIRTNYFPTTGQHVVLHTKPDWWALVKEDW